jgi:Ca2+-binding EF-hand superfamily protein
MYNQPQPPYVPQQQGYQQPQPPILPTQQGYQQPQVPSYQQQPTMQQQGYQPSQLYQNTQQPLYQTQQPTPQQGYGVMPTKQPAYQPYQPPQQPQQQYTPGQQPPYQPYYTQQYTTQDPQISNYFRMADKNNNGTIDQYELKTALGQCGFIFDDELAKRLIRMFDKNLNGRIDSNEFTMLYQYLMQMKNAFYAVDTNKNGLLEYLEVEQALRQGGYNINQQIVARLFKAFDTQVKGSLNFDGYLKLCVFLGTLKQNFSGYDRSGTGWVNFNFDQYVDSCVLLS